MKLLTLVIMLLTSFLSFAQDGRNVSKYNLTSGVGLKGFDPVAVFPEGGSKALKGKSEFSLIHGGVTYFFSSKANQERFESRPTKYEPTYGGWCAYAMASGSTVDIQAELFTINGNRAHYFVSSRAKQNFDRDLVNYENKADKFWKQISGESPRK